MRTKILMSFFISCPAFAFADGDGVMLANGLYIPDVIVRAAIVMLLCYLATSFFLALVRMLLNFRLKSKMISMGITGETAEKILRNGEENIDHAVKWFLLLLTGGIGFTVISCFPFGWLSIGILALCLSAGFAAYYFYLKKRKETM